MFTKPPQVFYSFFLDYSANDNRHLVREIIHKYTKQSQPVQPEAEGDPSPVGGTIPDKVPVSSLMPAATLVSGPSHLSNNDTRSSDETTEAQNHRLFSCLSCDAKFTKKSSLRFHQGRD